LAPSNTKLKHKYFTFECMRTFQDFIAFTFIVRVKINIIEKKNTCTFNNFKYPYIEILLLLKS